MLLAAEALFAAHEALGGVLGLRGFQKDRVLLHNYGHWPARYWANESTSCSAHKSRFVGLYIACTENINNL